MSIKYVTVPKDVEIKNPLTDEREAGMPEVSFKNFLLTNIFQNPIWNNGIVNISAGADIVSKFKKAKPGDVVELDSTEYAPLKQAFENPQYQVPGQMGPESRPGFPNYTPLLVQQLRPFFDAVLKASDTKPTPVETETPQN